VSILINRREEIKKKGFNMVLAQDASDIYVPRSAVNTDFSKIKIGIKTLEDAVYDLGDYKKISPRLASKDNVLKAIASGDVNTMKEISNFYYKTSGIYSRLCRFMAYLYRTPPEILLLRRHLDPDDQWHVHPISWRVPWLLQYFW
jgi:hypothetical protein